MPLPDQLSLLCIAIEEKARREAENIIANAERQAGDIVDTARADIKRLIEERILSEREAANRKASRRVDAADLRARQYILKEKKAILADLMKDAAKRLEELVHAPEYPHILRELSVRAISALRGNVCLIQVNDRDRAFFSPEMLEILASETGRQIRLMDNSVAILGGCLVYSEDRRQMVDYSFETLLKGTESELMAIVATRFLGERDDAGA
jgi:vacuolar-type H+-ATPase subunit E/Vma4